MKKLIAILFAALALVGQAQANSGGIEWDKFPKEKMSDMAALQRGAKLFVNYCLNCHSAAFVRYNRLRDIGLSEAEIKGNLLFAADKVGETMKVTLDAKQAKEFFGAAPPDLSLVARSRADQSKGSGSDYLYTYMRTFYRDSSKATGWNNLAFPSVAMPHALWELQGERIAKFEEIADPHDHDKKVHVFAGFEQTKPGSMTAQQYDDAVADLVAFLQWMAEPAQTQRYQLGVIVLIFLAFLTLFAWRLNAAYWKDVE